jgi:hypothetical protein
MSQLSQRAHCSPPICAPSVMIGRRWRGPLNGKEHVACTVLFREDRFPSLGALTDTPEANDGTRVFSGCVLMISPAMLVECNPFRSLICPSYFVRAGLFILFPFQKTVMMLSHGSPLRKRVGVLCLDSNVLQCSVLYIFT